MVLHIHLEGQEGEEGDEEVEHSGVGKHGTWGVLRVFVLRKQSFQVYIYGYDDQKRNRKRKTGRMLLMLENYGG